MEGQAELGPLDDATLSFPRADLLRLYGATIRELPIAPRLAEK